MNLDKFFLKFMLDSNYNPSEICRILYERNVQFSKFIVSTSWTEVALILGVLSKVYYSDSETMKTSVLKCTFCDEFRVNISMFLRHVENNDLNRSSWDMPLVLEHLVMYFDNIIQESEFCLENYQKWKKIFRLTCSVLQKTLKTNLRIIGLMEELILLLNKKIDVQNRVENELKSISIYPNPVDFYEVKQLIPSIRKGPYKSCEQYLDIQFRLLKEDFMNAVRNEIIQYRKEIGPTQLKKNPSVWVYRNVECSGFVIDKENPRKKLMHVIEFCSEDKRSLLNYKDNERMNKTFMNGSLLFFSCTNFTTFCIATLEDRNIVNSDLISIKVSVVGNPFDLKVNSYYDMIEPIVFFDAYFQTLRSLQVMDPKQFPMKKYIIDVDMSPRRPDYAASNDVCYNIANFPVQIHKDSKWPPKEVLNLNESQYTAFKAALTHQFTVILGPPGTGKTHLGRKIIDALLNNKKFRKAPILVVCSRNSSLDHILQYFAESGRKVVRLGGQSKSKILQECSIRNKTKKIFTSAQKSCLVSISSLKSRLEKEVESGRYEEIQELALLLESEVDSYIDKCECDDARALFSSHIELLGATTSGASRLYRMINYLQPEIVIVEEAAEVLEAQIISTLPRRCQHLILIGDHHQLRPIPASHSSVELNMDISLFERLVNNGMKYYCLTEQHRMRPEIASLISPLIYPELTNHPSVDKYPHIVGIAKNLFFLDHRISEDESTVDSHLNKYEGTFLVSLASYLIKQGYQPKQITILTGYTAQQQYLKMAVKKYPNVTETQIRVIDNYQGEENEIVLLSLVRSNSASIGFLAKSNRINVAFSRAKKGLYIIGNMSTLKKHSILWKQFSKILEQSKSIGVELPLFCPRHKTVTKVSKAAQMDQMENGGCGQLCNFILKCGHSCQLKCHPSFEQHEQDGCMQPYLKSSCGEDKFDRFCCDEYEETYSSQDWAEVQSNQHRLKCGHTVESPRNMNIEMNQCRQPCTRSPCGLHHCPLLCFEKCIPPEECRRLAFYKLSCGHTVPTACYRLKQINSYVTSGYWCREPCQKNSCAVHECMKECWEPCGACEVSVLKKLPCGHSVQWPCGQSVAGHICRETVSTNSAVGVVYKQCFQVTSTNRSCVIL